MRLRNLYTIVHQTEDAISIVIDSRRFDFSILNKRFPKRELFIQLKHSVMAFGSHNAEEVFIIDLGEGNKLISHNQKLTVHSHQKLTVHPFNQKLTVFPNCRRSATNIEFTYKELNGLFSNLKVFVAINGCENVNADYFVNGLMEDYEENSDNLYVDVVRNPIFKVLLELDTIYIDSKYFSNSGNNGIDIYSLIRGASSENETVGLAIGLLSIDLDKLP